MKQPGRCLVANMVDKNFASTYPWPLEKIKIITRFVFQILYLRYRMLLINYYSEWSKRINFRVSNSKWYNYLIRFRRFKRSKTFNDTEKKDSEKFRKFLILVFYGGRSFRSRWSWWLGCGKRLTWDRFSWRRSSYKL